MTDNGVKDLKKHYIVLLTVEGFVMLTLHKIAFALKCAREAAAEKRWKDYMDIMFADENNEWDAENPFCPIPN